MPRKKASLTQAEQSARFIETAIEIGADKSGKKFEKAFKTVVPEKSKKK